MKTLRFNDHDDENGIFNSVSEYTSSQESKGNEVKASEKSKGLHESPKRSQTVSPEIISINKENLDKFFQAGETDECKCVPLTQN